MACERGPTSSALSMMQFATPASESSQIAPRFLMVTGVLMAFRALRAPFPFPLAMMLPG